MIRFAILSAALLLPAAALADDQDATKLAQEVLDKGATLYEAHDASALAATFTEDAEITITGKDMESGTYKSRDTQGRPAIERFYQSLFRGERSDAKAKNRVEVAHFVGSDLLIIHGHFQPDTRNDSEIPFIQVRTKSGDKWLILNLQVFLISKS